jgi:hypothetical protein
VRDVVLRCVPSDKNRPAVDFLAGLQDGVKQSFDNGFLIRIPVARGRALLRSGIRRSRLPCAGTGERLSGACREAVSGGLPKNCPIEFDS